MMTEYDEGQLAAYRGLPPVTTVAGDEAKTAWHDGYTSVMSDELKSLHRMAARAGVPSKWLKAEAEAGRVPGLCAGGRWLFVPSVVMRTLAEMAKESNQ